MKHLLWNNESVPCFFSSAELKLFILHKFTKESSEIPGKRFILIFSLGVWRPCTGLLCCQMRWRRSCNQIMSRLSQAVWPLQLQDINRNTLEPRDWMESVWQEVTQQLTSGLFSFIPQQNWGRSDSTDFYVFRNDFSDDVSMWSNALVNLIFILFYFLNFHGFPKLNLFNWFTFGVSPVLMTTSLHKSV